MELMAVLTLIIVLPKHSKVEIHTDSNNVITKFSKFRNIISFRKKLKEKNLLLWELLFEVIKRFDINVKFKKVKAHSGNIHNDKADSLAKSGCDNNIVTFKDSISLEKSRLY